MRAMLCIFITTLASCSKLGPECDRLSKCCEAMPNAVSQEGCQRTLDEHGTDDGAEVFCQSAADTLVASGQCDQEEVSDGPMSTTPVTCQALRRCCQQISSGPYRSDCLVAVVQMESQPNANTSCQLALDGYRGDGWCENGPSLTAEDDNERCQDGIDNDQNGHLDCADWSCSRNPNVTVCPHLEDQDSTCRDGIDNDGDGFFDCDDYDCSRNEFVHVCG